jgi:Asp-tRNA(Asn)/Glu-tRNA(Gln) amidotransferase B subunit
MLQVKIITSLNFFYAKVAVYRSGKTKALYQLVGQLKNTSNNQFDIGLVVKTLKHLLDNE